MATDLVAHHSNAPTSKKEAASPSRRSRSSVGANTVTISATTSELKKLGELNTILKIPEGCTNFFEHKKAYRKYVRQCERQVLRLLNQKEPVHGLEIAKIWSTMLQNIFLHFVLSVRTDQSTQPFTGRIIIAVGGSNGRDAVVPSGDLDPIIIMDSLSRNGRFETLLHKRYRELQGIVPGLDGVMPISLLEDVGNKEAFPMEKMNEVLSLKVLWEVEGLRNEFINAIRESCKVRKIELITRFTALQQARRERNRDEGIDTASVFDPKFGHGGTAELTEVACRAGIGKGQGYREFLSGLDENDQRTVREWLDSVLHARAFLWATSGRGHRKQVISFGSEQFEAYEKKYGASGIARLREARRKGIELCRKLTQSDLARGEKLCDTVEPYLSPNNKWEYRLKVDSSASREAGIFLNVEGKLVASPNYLFSPLNLCDGFYSLLLVSQIHDIPIAEETLASAKDRIASVTPDSLKNPLFLHLLRAPGAVWKSLSLMKFSELNILQHLLPYWIDIVHARYEWKHRAEHMYCEPRAIARVSHLHALEKYTPPANGVLTERQRQVENHFLVHWKALRDNERLALVIALLAEEIPDRADRRKNITVGKWVDSFKAAYPEAGASWVEHTDFLMTHRRELAHIIGDNLITFEDATKRLMKIVNRPEELRLLLLFTFAAYDHPLGAPESAKYERLSTSEWRTCVAVCEHVMNRMAASNGPVVKRFPVIEALNAGLPIEASLSRFSEDFKEALTRGVPRVLLTGEPFVAELPREENEPHQLVLLAEDKLGLVRSIAAALRKLGVICQDFQFYTRRETPKSIALTPETDPDDPRLSGNRNIVVDYFTVSPPDRAPHEEQASIRQVLLEAARNVKVPTDSEPPGLVLSKILTNPAASVTIEQRGSRFELAVSYDRENEKNRLERSIIGDLWYAGAALVTELGGDIRAGKPIFSRDRESVIIRYSFECGDTLEVMREKLAKLVAPPVE